MTKNELHQIHMRYFHNEKQSPIINMATHIATYTGNENTRQKAFEKNRSVLIHDSSKKGTFIGNLKQTYKF